MSNIGWLAIVIIAMWITSTFGAWATKDSSVYIYPGALTFLIGLGFLFKGN